MLRHFGRMTRLIHVIRLDRLLASRKSACSCLCHMSSHSQGDVRVRFAPSPTGGLHLGGLRTALYNFLFARTNKGKFILRIEDTDQTRLVPGAMDKLHQMLDWAGIQIDEGPGIGGDFGPYIQSERLTTYVHHASTLLESGAAYRCFCTARRLELLRKESARRRETPRYDNRCRHLSDAEIEEKLINNVPYVLRFKLKTYRDSWHDLVYGDIATDVASIEGDPVIVKSDGFPTYHLANVVDDHLMKISHVMRGKEWQVSTTKHILMYRAFGWQPPQFAHFPLLLRKDGQKLSKRQQDFHLETLKDQGFLPEAVLNLLTSTGSGFTVQSTAGLDLGQLIDTFDLSKLGTQSTVIDIDLLKPLNRIHLQSKLSSPRQRALFIQQVSTALSGSHSLASNPGSEGLNEEYIGNVLDWAVTSERVNRLQDLMEDPVMAVFWRDPDLNADGITTGNALGCAAGLRSTISFLQQMDSGEFSALSSQQLKGFHKDVALKESGLKIREYLRVLRYSLTGLLSGPPLHETMCLLGKARTLARLRAALDRLL